MSSKKGKKKPQGFRKTQHPPKPKNQRPPKAYQLRSR